MTTEPSTTKRQLRRSLGLREAAAEFWRHPSPWMIGGMLVAAAAARVAVGNWQPTDALVPAAMLAVFPFAEWVIHVCILHWRPRRLLGVTVDSLLARKHREHHGNPRDVPLIFIPWRTLILLIPTLIAIALLAFPRTGLGLTFLLTLGAMGLVYEWTHYLIHTDYKPRHRIYRAVWRNHRHHHFKNEHYWFTVTTAGTADRLLGTYPDPETVETSPTARNLHAAGPTRR
ncbi:sterol desaturase family protein [Rhodococcus tukisamuensis]|uniref:Fatty acid hydroxylase superfamily protein n=1 Tax=Rhodococcus tukisamuensis TaxID=168276 RepID=A0A1G6YW82_9NOCA|nr:sterol desaturase family protein [Rhodococcus tukisamuensis]SDD94532.1 Fatty acid hydroxylase superfamily protein [Rhodococcus tukisamuensis]